MHPLIIQQAIITEIANQVKLQGLKALNESKVDVQLIAPALISKCISAEDIDRWLAHLHIEGYVKITADDHRRNPRYIQLLPKGLSAEASNYFKDNHKQLRKSEIKYWVDVIGQFIIGVTAILALLVSANIISCNKSKESTQQFVIKEINHTTTEKKSNSTLPKSISNSLTVDTLSPE